LKDARAEIARLRAENYSDLLDQMDEAWGTVDEGSSDVGRVELQAFLETRSVHKPTTRLREELDRLLLRVTQLEDGNLHLGKEVDGLRESARASLEESRFLISRFTIAVIEATHERNFGDDAPDGPKVRATMQQERELAEEIVVALSRATPQPERVVVCEGVLTDHVVNDETTGGSITLWNPPLTIDKKLNGHRVIVSVEKVWEEVGDGD
jgi:hypothetical protein